MKKIKLLMLSAFLVTSILIVFGKGKNGSNTPPNNTNPDWRSTYLFEVWNYAVLPGTITPCGNTFPITSGSNTCPTLSPTNSNYYALITVESLDKPSERKQFCRANGGNTPIEIPYAHRYRITVDFVEKCSNCMAGHLGVPNGQSRRITWQAKQEYPKYKLAPNTNFYYVGLRSC